MFGSLTENLQNVFSKILPKNRLTESNISDAVREIRLALLEADVAYSVVKKFIKGVKEKVLGDELIKSVKPGQHFTKVIHDELMALMGSSESVLLFGKSCTVIMLCGLQGSGKTTHCAKLAKFLLGKSYQKKTMIAACDLQRPAAIKQLELLGSQINVPVFSKNSEKDPVAVAKEALVKAKSEGFDVLIVDTAGRLHIDDELMEQLSSIEKALSPNEVFFVANASMGQDAVKTAAEFDRRIPITGTILTMLDSGARGGAAISIKEVTGKPLKFEGIGEKLDDFQLFNPNSMADRILGMGDTINLVKRAQEHMDEEEAKKLEAKIRKASFTYSDYLKHMQSMKKMGPISKLMKMLPGMSTIKDLEFSDKEFLKVESIILSMTLSERSEKSELSVGRRKRIARGSGTKIEDVNKLIKSFRQVKKMFKGMPNMKRLEKMMGGSICR